MTNPIEVTIGTGDVIAAFESAQLAVSMMPALARIVGRCVECECELPPHATKPERVFVKATGVFVCRPF